ncbi:hypothetical protein DICPUDRAFT_27830 [Dictyostelium purpureum]|uniref:CoA-transferase family III protein n=1 Tax=Dictyostelium purpureum TaxID=5786 RepID=F0ZAR7_DICPU|nr:uncharacterized protein DICPUDRAFT_27830 [Dictyostelium purpureum]EGC38969.1 hypothetical protein DICPUDRAFT_27830 [Dictyostelium purpureum]|eukprot:XP_003284534.1 hypothetical protein DICPUDRAFT_27830 [Dictyostelium purpureum]
MFLNKIIKKSFIKNHFNNKLYCYFSTTTNESKWGGGISNRPLGGLKVLDLARVLAGPWTTQLLGDLGADVIKVESIEKGDDTRSWGPPFRVDSEGNKSSAYFSCTNRNKRSIAVDISTEKGQEIIKSLAAEADVMIENFKVGGLKKYKLDYKSISELNPSIVYCSITGFGQSGPYASFPGYDFSIQAMGGLMGITGDENNPYKCGVAIVDVMTGLYANVAIQAALHNRYKTGKGQYIDISLLDVQSAFLANHEANYLLTGQNSKRIGNSHPSISPYDSLKTKDGFIVVAVGNNSQFTSMCKVLNLNDLPNDPLFNTNPNRVANRAQLLDILTKETLKYETEELDQLFSNSNVPSSPINTLDKVYNHKQIKHRNMVWSLYQTDTINMIGNPIHFSETDLHSKQSIKENLPPPQLGEHTDQVLKNVLSLSENELKELRDNKIIQ